MFTCLLQAEQGMVRGTVRVSAGLTSSHEDRLHAERVMAAQGGSVAHGEVERFVDALEGVGGQHRDLVDHDDVCACEPCEVRGGLVSFERRTLEEAPSLLSLNALCTVHPLISRAALPLEAVTITRRPSERHFCTSSSMSVDLPTPP